MISQLSIIKHRIKRCWDAAERVHGITGENTTKLFVEVVYDWYMYGASDEDFFTLEFYRKNHREKCRWITSRKNNNIVKDLYSKDVIAIFDHKALFVKKFRDFIRRESVYSGDLTSSEIVDFIDKHGNVIVKPEGSACGQGVYKIGAGEKRKIEELILNIEKGNSYMIEQMIVQHSGMSALNPDSVNTIRIETIVDNDGTVHINNMLAMLGTTSAIINNAHAGGIMCHIDPETGIIDSKGVNPEGKASWCILRRRMSC